MADQPPGTPVSDVKATPIKDVVATTPVPVVKAPPPVPEAENVNAKPVTPRKPRNSNGLVIFMTVIVMAVLIGLAYMAYSKSKQ